MRLKVKPHEGASNTVRTVSVCYLSFLPSGLKIENLFIPDLCSIYLRVLEITPKPYFTLLLKFIEDASSKYLVGQLSSPILKPK